MPRVLRCSSLCKRELQILWAWNIHSQNFLDLLRQCGDLDGSHDALHARPVFSLLPSLQLVAVREGLSANFYLVDGELPRLHAGPKNLARPEVSHLALLWPPEADSLVMVVVVELAHGLDFGSLHLNRRCLPHKSESITDLPHGFGLSGFILVSLEHRLMRGISWKLGPRCISRRTLLSLLSYQGFVVGLTKVDSTQLIILIKTPH